jgi:hypothetical protein
MSFGNYELIHTDATQLVNVDSVEVHQSDRDLMVLGTAEAVGQGGAAFSLVCEVEIANVFTPAAIASVSNFDNPQVGFLVGRRQSLALPVPAGMRFRFRVDPIAGDFPRVIGATIRVWVMKAD